MLNIALRLKRDKHEGAFQAALLLEKAGREELEKKEAACKARRWKALQDRYRFVPDAVERPQVHGPRQVSEDQQQSHSRNQRPGLRFLPGLPPVSAEGVSDEFLPPRLQPPISVRISMERTNSELSTSHAEDHVSSPAKNCRWQHLEASASSLQKNQTQTPISPHATAEKTSMVSPILKPSPTFQQTPPLDLE